MASNNSTTDWNISTDIYDISNSLNNLKKRYIDDEDETTLALGIFGYITDTEAKKIQTSTIMTGEMGNEMFPTRAKLTKNVLTHAIYSNIQDINATPSTITINIGLKVDDFENYMSDNGRFIFDSKCPIFIGDYEFHFDYDVILVRSETSSNSFVYSAHYDMSVENRLSNITDPYLKQPFVIKIENFYYIVFQATVRQISIEETIDKIISDSIIENKTYTFDFNNQLADFDVIINDNGKETILTPVPYGSSIENIDKYCWYIFVTDNTVRVTFDNKSFIPGLNSDITIKAYTTLGSKGIFNYRKIDESSDGFYVEMSSEKYEYEKVTCYMVAATDSMNGSDRKSKAELQKLIPKAALSRGSITTETDIENYFNLIDSESNRLIMKKKTDNQFSRVWYGYFLLKDDDNNIIPTNTVNVQLVTSDSFMKLAEDGRYILPAGSIIKYIPEDNIAYVIDEADVPVIYSDEYFGKEYYYITVYNIILNPDPLYAAFYLTISNKDSFFTFNWVNENLDLQFVATRCNFQRNLLTDQQIYKLNFKIAQSISADFGLYCEEIIDEINKDNEIETKKIITNNMKCVLVMYKEGTPYRWTEAKFKDFDLSTFVSSWQVELETDNGLDDKNLIKINNLHVVGYDDDINYGYFEPNTKVVLYILGKFEEGEFGRYNLDSIAPGFEGYSVTNVYEVDSGINFYENFTNVLDTKVYTYEDSNDKFKISGVPVVGLHYMTTESHSRYLIDAISERKAYIDYCLQLLENAMNVDFKFFNTYGPSSTYSIGDRKRTLIGHVDLSLKFRVSLKSTSDMYTKDELIIAIKEYIEDLYETEDWHAPNMITDITNKYNSRINFIEFMNFNDFWAGIQHIIKLDDIDDISVVPEFINIRNRYNEITGYLEPDIDIEIVY